MTHCHILAAMPADWADEIVKGDTRFIFAPLDLCRVPERSDSLWVFVDWIMPDHAGLEICREIRANPAFTHANVTMVLESDDLEERRRALRAGADDYMVGPLTQAGAVSRVLNALSRPPSATLQPDLVAGDLTINLAGRQARANGRPIPLPPNEFRLLKFLAQRPNRLFRRDEIIAGLGKDYASLDERTVDVWIGRLRRALRDAGDTSSLRTVRGEGYVLDIH